MVVLNVYCTGDPTLTVHVCCQNILAVLVHSSTQLFLFTSFICTMYLPGVWLPMVTWKKREREHGGCGGTQYLGYNLIKFVYLLLISLVKSLLEHNSYLRCWFCH